MIFILFILFLKDAQKKSLSYTLKIVFWGRFLILLDGYATGSKIFG